jgi:hypothetical protein
MPGGASPASHRLIEALELSAQLFCPECRAICPEQSRDDLPLTDTIARLIEVFEFRKRCLMDRAVPRSCDRTRRRRVSSSEIRGDPRNKNAWHKLGLSHLNARECAHAREGFSRVLGLDATIAMPSFG